MKAELLQINLPEFSAVPLTGAMAVGNDLVYLPDFKNALTDVFIGKVYTLAEIEYCTLFSEPELRYASTWAAKEAVYKALKQLGRKTPGWNSIEITRLKPAGQPLVNVPEAYADLTISLSITHDGDYCWAIALITLKSSVH